MTLRPMENVTHRSPDHNKKSAAVLVQIPIKRDSPTFLQKMVNYAGSMARHAKNGFQVASEAEIARRLSICEQCPKFVAHACQVCGCNCNSNGNALRNKLASASATCPHPDGARW